MQQLKSIRSMQQYLHQIKYIDNYLFTDILLQYSISIKNLIQVFANDISVNNLINIMDKNINLLILYINEELINKNIPAPFIINFDPYCLKIRNKIINIDEYASIPIFFESIGIIVNEYLEIDETNSIRKYANEIRDTLLYLQHIKSYAIKNFNKEFEWVFNIMNNIFAIIIYWGRSKHI